MDAESKRIIDALWAMSDRYDENPEYAICAEAANTLERLSTEKEDLDAHLKAINDCLSEQLRRAAPENSQPKSWAAGTLEKLIPEIEDSMVLVECQREALREGVDALRRAAPENKPLACEGCDNQKRSPKHSAFSYEDCMRCRRHWPGRHTHKPEGSA